MKKYLAGCTSLMMFSVFAQGQHLAWAKQFEGTGSEDGSSIAVDDNRNVYVTGNFKNTADFDPGFGTFNLTSSGSADIFITKLDVSGNLIWANQFGGSSDDRGKSITVDSAGNVYATGSFQGTADFDPGPGTFNLSSSGSFDIFIIKLDASGNLIWAKTIGGTAEDIGRSMTVGALGAVYVTGNFGYTADFDPGSGTFNLTALGGRDIFIIKLDVTGNLIWAKQFGGSSDDLGQSVTVDVAGNVYATGSFSDVADFDPGPGVVNLSVLLGTNAFIVKLDSSGNLTWAKHVGGGTTDDQGKFIAVDAAGNVYTSGHFEGTGDFDPGPGTVNLSAGAAGQGQAGFIVKLSAAGNYIWAKQYNGQTHAYTGGIVVDAFQNVYTTGSTNTLSNNWSVTTYYTFINQLDAAGNLIWATQIGSFGAYALGETIAIDAAGSVYVAGWFSFTVDFDPGPGTFNLNSQGGHDVFILKLSATSISISGAIITETGIPVPGVTVTLTGNNTSSMTTAANGLYNFSVASGGSYTITPLKNNDVVVNNGITSLDVLLMRRHSLGVATLGSPYKIIAAAEASAEGDTLISALDLLYTRQLILGSATSYPTNRLWQFVSSDNIFHNLMHPFPFDKTRTYTNITTNQTSQDFIGIKLGDVNGSWDAGVP